MSCQSDPARSAQANEITGGAAVPLKVVAFLCNWCSYAGADKAGSQELPVPAEISVIRVMCSGRIEPVLILESFQKGADGVMVLACHPGDCHYKEGNLRAFCRAELLQRLIPQLGIDARRFFFDYVSAAEAEKFSRCTGEFVQRLKSISN